MTSTVAIITQTGIVRPRWERAGFVGRRRIAAWLFVTGCSSSGFGATVRCRLSRCLPRCCYKAVLIVLRAPIGVLFTARPVCAFALSVVHLRWIVVPCRSLRDDWR